MRRERVQAAYLKACNSSTLYTFFPIFYRIFGNIDSFAGIKKNHPSQRALSWGDWDARPYHYNRHAHGVVGESMGENEEGCR